MKRIDWLPPAFAVAAVIWALALPVAAVVRGNSDVRSPGRVASDLTYVAGVVVCHQRPERSFQMAGQPLPVCARCAGIYWSAAVAAVVFMSAGLGRHRPRRSFLGSNDRSDVRWTALLAVLPTAMTLIWEWTTGSTPSNAVRAVAGVPIGVLVSWLIVATARRTLPSG